MTAPTDRENVERWHEELHGMIAGKALFDGQQEYVRFEDYYALLARAEAATAEQCVEVKPLAEAMDDLLGEAMGVVTDSACAFYDYQAGQFSERRILSAITARPASEVYAEGFAAAIEAACDEVHQECWTDGNQDQVTPELMAEQETTQLAIRAIRSLHTDASRAALNRKR